jgi:hypothetical protein
MKKIAILLLSLMCMRASAQITTYYYAIKKIRYAYLDDIEVYRSLYNIVRDGTDDIQIGDEEEEYYRTTYKTIKEYLPNRKYQYYLFLLDICETDKAIKKSIYGKGNTN